MVIAAEAISLPVMLVELVHSREVPLPERGAIVMVFPSIPVPIPVAKVSTMVPSVTVAPETSLVGVKVGIASSSLSHSVRMPPAS
ncbi:hypothetical protein FQZ97_873450 [compost metagenome]